MNSKIRFVSACLVMGLPGLAASQAYPNKPVRCSSAMRRAAARTSWRARLAPAYRTPLKQQFMIENRPGANANIAAKLAADAPADGYTILFMSVAHIMSKPVYKNLGYDIERDFVPITVVTNVPTFCACILSLPVKNSERIDRACESKTRNAHLCNFGCRQSRTFRRRDVQDDDKHGHVADPLQRRRAAGGGSRRRTSDACVQYSAADHAAYSIGPRARDCGNHGQTRSSTAGCADDCRIRRSGLFDEHRYGAVIQAKTPREIVVRLNQEMIKALAVPDVKERLAGFGADVVGNTPEEAAALIKLEVAKYTKVANAAHISADQP